MDHHLLPAAAAHASSPARALPCPGTTQGIYSNKNQKSGARPEGFPGIPTPSDSGVSHGIACPQRLLLRYLWPGHDPPASAELLLSPSGERHTWTAPDCGSRPWGALSVPGVPRLGESFPWLSGITTSPSKNCIHPFERPHLGPQPPSSHPITQRLWFPSPQFPAPALVLLGLHWQ